MTRMIRIIRKRLVYNVDCRLSIKHGLSIKRGQQTLPISIKVAPMNHVSWPAVHYGKSFCSGKFTVLLLFIEIKETICDKAFKRAFNSNGCENYCNFVFKSHSKKLEASSFNNIN